MDWGSALVESPVPFVHAIPSRSTGCVVAEHPPPAKVVQTAPPATVERLIPSVGAISTPDHPREREARRWASELTRPASSGDPTDVDGYGRRTAAALGFDFSQVRIHGDAKAFAIAQAASPFGQLPGDRSDLAAAPPEVRAGLAGPGIPIAPALAWSLSERLGADLRAVRIHTDAAAASAARALGAQAFTYGRHVAFGRGAWAPDTTRGHGLLAHELTHVAQQAFGDAAGEEVQESVADRAAAGGMLQRFGSGLPRVALRLSRGDIQRLTITLHGNGSATFRLDVEGGESVIGDGTASGLEVGEYRLGPGPSLTEMKITQADGSSLPGSGFQGVVPSTVVPALRRITAPVPLIIQSVGGPRPAGGGGNVPTTEHERRQAIDALPQRIRDFIFSVTGPQVQPDAYATVLRIAHAIADLSDEELAEYRARTVGSTNDLSRFERAVTAWLTELRARRAAIAEEEAATTKLYGKESLYELYAQWQRTNNTGAGQVPTGFAAPAGQLVQYEGTPFASLRVPTDATSWQQYYRFRQALDAAGFSNIGAFEAALRRFLVGFRERAFYLALESLGRYEHFLTEQQARYQDSAVLDALHARLSTARMEVQAADRYGRHTTLAGIHDPYDTAAGERHMEMRDEHARMERQVRASVAQATPDEPITTRRDFDPLELARQSRSELGPFLQGVISERLAQLRSTRTHLEGNHELIFKLDDLVATTKRRAHIDPNTIWARVIADYSAPSLNGALLGLMVGVVTIALTFLTAGTGLPALLVAGGSLLASSAFAYEAYRDYEFQSGAHGSELLSNEPWFGWVVIAVVGVGLDLGAVGALARGIRASQSTLRALHAPAAALEATGDLPRFNAAVQQLVDDPNVRRSVLEAAAARVQARQGWQAVSEAPTVVPRGVARGSVFGLDLVIDAALALPRTAYAIWLEARVGVRSFQRWIHTQTAVELFGDSTRFTSARMRDVQAIYHQASAALERVATHARTLGMTEAEVEAALQWWVRRQQGTADDMIRLLDQRRALPIDPTILSRMSAEVDVGQLRLAAASIDDGALRAALLNDGRVWRFLANSDYDPATLLGAWRSFNASRPPSQTLKSATFGDYLFHSSSYRTSLGAPVSRPLTAVIPKWSTLAGAQRTRAVFEAAEPRLFAALRGTGEVPGLNAQTTAELRALLQADVVGPGVTMYEGARSTVMGMANEIIGRTTRTQSELRAVLALADSSGSTGSIGERFLAQNLTHPAFSRTDIAHPRFTRSQMPGLQGPSESFVPDRVLTAAGETLEVKTGPTAGNNIVDQARNYDLLRRLSQTDPAIAGSLGGPVRRHSWVVLPGGDAQVSAQSAARRIFRQLDAEDLATHQRVFYLDETGALQQVTGATTQTRAGATIHEAVGLTPPATTP